MMQKQSNLNQSKTLSEEQKVNSKVSDWASTLDLGLDQCLLHLDNQEELASLSREPMPSDLDPESLPGLLLETLHSLAESFTTSSEWSQSYVQTVVTDILAVKNKLMAFRRITDQDLRQLERRLSDLKRELSESKVRVHQSEARVFEKEKELDEINEQFGQANMFKNRARPYTEKGVQQLHRFTTMKLLREQVMTELRAEKILLETAKVQLQDSEDRIKEAELALFTRKELKLKELEGLRQEVEHGIHKIIEMTRRDQTANFYDSLPESPRTSVCLIKPDKKLPLVPRLVGLEDMTKKTKLGGLQTRNSYPAQAGQLNTETFQNVPLIISRKSVPGDWMLGFPESTRERDFVWRPRDVPEDRTQDVHHTSGKFQKRKELSVTILGGEPATVCTTDLLRDFEEIIVVNPSCHPDDSDILCKDCMILARDSDSRYIQIASTEQSLSELRQALGVMKEVTGPLHQTKSENIRRQWTFGKCFRGVDSSNSYAQDEKSHKSLANGQKIAKNAEIFEPKMLENKRRAPLEKENTQNLANSKTSRPPCKLSAIIQPRLRPLLTETQEYTPFKKSHRGSLTCRSVSEVQKQRIQSELIKAIKTKEVSGRISSFSSLGRTANSIITSAKNDSEDLSPPNDQAPQVLKKEEKPAEVLPNVSSIAAPNPPAGQQAEQLSPEAVVQEFSDFESPENLLEEGSSDKTKYKCGLIESPQALELEQSVMRSHSQLNPFTKKEVIISSQSQELDASAIEPSGYQRYLQMRSDVCNPHSLSTSITSKTVFSRSTPVPQPATFLNGSHQTYPTSKLIPKP